MNKKYIVWVGGIDDHYASEEEAKKAKQKWTDAGYDDVQIEVDDGYGWRIVRYTMEP